MGFVFSYFVNTQQSAFSCLIYNKEKREAGGEAATTQLQGVGNGWRGKSIMLLDNNRLYHHTAPCGIFSYVVTRCCVLYLTYYDQKCT